MKHIKKRKLKKKFIYFVVGVIVFFSFVFVFSFQRNDDLIHEESINYVNSILERTDEFDSNFLSWVLDNYGEDSLKRLDTTLENHTYDKQMWHELTGNSYLVLQDFYHHKYDEEHVTILEGNKNSVQISYAGDVSLADNWHIMPYYHKREKGIFGLLSEDIVSYMKQSDWMIVNNEFSFSNRGEPMAKKLYTFRGNPENVNLYREMNVDMVTLANNHVYDFGLDSFLDTLDTLKQANIPYVGAGRNLDEAIQSHYLIINGYKIAFLNATRAEKFILTPGATENSAGVFRCYDPTLFANRISQEKQQSDYVVALVHFGKEDSHALEEVQVESSKLYIDSGADMVIGSHAHVLQGVEFYKGKLIAYNLGNFLFNRYTIDTGILTWKLQQDGSSEFYFLPAIQKDCYTDIVKDSQAISLYQKMTEWSINAEFLEDGKIVEKNIE